MSQVTLTVRPNGPFRIDDPNGVSLCRCGASANRPFCDGSHKTACPPPNPPAKLG